MKSSKSFFDTLILFLTKKIPYLFTLKNVLFISIFFGGIQVFITIFLEPHGTENYQVAGRNFKLAGYAICFVFSFLVFYGIERWIFNLQNKVWKVYQEIISKILISISIATASYFYNISIINSISPSLQGWIEHMVVFAWPYIPLFIPFMIIIYLILLRSHSPKENKLTIRGQNQDDMLKISESQFVYAESEQNYVKIFFKKGDHIDSKFMRSSLQNIEDQIKIAVRVHRSYLINPAYLKSLNGNKRKRTAILKYVDSTIPVSANFDKNSILESSI